MQNQDLVLSQESTNAYYRKEVRLKITTLLFIPGSQTSILFVNSLICKYQSFCTTIVVKYCYLIIFESL